VCRLSVGGRGTPLQKALSTIHGPALRQLEGNRRLFTALGANCGRHHTLVAHANRRLVPLGFASFATFRFILETFVSVKELLTSGEDELRPTVHTLEDSISVLHSAYPPFSEQALYRCPGFHESLSLAASPAGRRRLAELVPLQPGLLTNPLASQSCLNSAPFSWFQVKGMFLDLFDDVFLLDLPLETAKSVLQRFSVLKSYFRQSTNTPVPIERYTKQNLDNEQNSGILAHGTGTSQALFVPGDHTRFIRAPTLPRIPAPTAV